MTRKTMTTGIGLVLLSGSIWLGITAKRPNAQGAPITSATTIPNSMAGLLTGKLYPNTVKRSDLMASYRLVSLIDAQGRPAVCATQGTMLTLGGETFLVAYLLPPPPAKTADATTPAPFVAPADADAQLTLINMHDVQAIGGIHDVPPPAEAPAVPDAPTNPTAPVGTAAP